LSYATSPSDDSEEVTEKVEILGIPYTTVGDCVKVGKINDAIHGGAGRVKDITKSGVGSLFQDLILDFPGRSFFFISDYLLLCFLPGIFSHPHYFLFLIICV
jgi:hypothetical protein